MKAMLLSVLSVTLLAGTLDQDDPTMFGSMNGSNVVIEAEIDRIRNGGAMADTSESSSGSADEDPCTYSVEMWSGTLTWICTQETSFIGGGQAGMSSGLLEVDTPLGPVSEVSPPGYVVTESDLRSLPIEPGGLQIQPPGGSVLVNKDVIAYSQAAPQLYTTTVLGVTTEVRVVPVEWTWNFHDGSGPFTTTTPGGLYPDKSVTGRYDTLTQGVIVELETTWEGQYRVAGSSQWWDVAGTAYTQASSAPFDVEEAPTRLVEP